MFVTKSEKVREYVSEGDCKRALAIAKDFRLGITREQHDAMVRAHECLNGCGNFYSQIGFDPAQLIDKGIETVRELYGVGGKYDQATENRGILEAHTGAA